MHIKDLAERAGVTVKAVRYYESRGLITPRRESNGYRAYDDADVRVVREVRALLSLGLTVEQTHPFVECLRAGNDRADTPFRSNDEPHHRDHRRRVRPRGPRLRPARAGGVLGPLVRPDQIAPVIEQIAGERAETLRVVKINQDENPLVSARYRVLGLPTMLVFDRGEPIAQITGARPKSAIVRELDKVLPAPA